MPQARRQTVLLSGNGDRPIKSSDIKLLLFPEDWANFYCVDTSVLDFIQPSLASERAAVKRKRLRSQAERHAEQLADTWTVCWSHNCDMTLTRSRRDLGKERKKEEGVMKGVRHAWMPLKVAWSWSNPAERKGSEQDLAPSLALCHTC